MARKRRAVECVSYLDDDPYEEAEEKNLMIDLNAEPDRNKPTTGLNKARQAGVKKESERSTLCNGEGKASEVEQLRNQLKDERREHRRALLDIRTLIDRHIAKVKILQHSQFNIQGNLGENTFNAVLNRLTRHWRMRMTKQR